MMTAWYTKGYKYICKLVALAAIQCFVLTNIGFAANGGIASREKEVRGFGHAKSRRFNGASISFAANYIDAALFRPLQLKSLKESKLRSDELKKDLGAPFPSGSDTLDPFQTKEDRLRSDARYDYKWPIEIFDDDYVISLSEDKLRERLKKNWYYRLYDEKRRDGLVEAVMGARPVVDYLNRYFSKANEGVFVEQYKGKGLPPYLRRLFDSGKGKERFKNMSIYGSYPFGDPELRPDDLDITMVMEGSAFGLWTIDISRDDREKIFSGYAKEERRPRKITVVIVGSDNLEKGAKADDTFRGITTHKDGIKRIIASAWWRNVTIWGKPFKELTGDEENIMRVANSLIDNANDRLLGKGEEDDYTRYHKVIGRLIDIAVIINNVNQEGKVDLDGLLSLKRKWRDNLITKDEIMSAFIDIKDALAETAKSLSLEKGRLAADRGFFHYDMDLDSMTAYNYVKKVLAEKGYDISGLGLVFDEKWVEGLRKIKEDKKLPVPVKLEKYKRIIDTAVREAVNEYLIHPQEIETFITPEINWKDMRRWYERRYKGFAKKIHPKLPRDIKNDLFRFYKYSLIRSYLINQHGEQRFNLYLNKRYIGIITLFKHDSAAHPDFLSSAYNGYRIDFGGEKLYGDRRRDRQLEIGSLTLNKALIPADKLREITSRIKETASWRAPPDFAKRPSRAGIIKLAEPIPLDLTSGKLPIRALEIKAMGNFSEDGRAAPPDFGKAYNYGGLKTITFVEGGRYEPKEPPVIPKGGELLSRIKNEYNMLNTAIANGADTVIPVAYGSYKEKFYGEDMGFIVLGLSDPEDKRLSDLFENNDIEFTEAKADKALFYLGRSIRKAHNAGILRLQPHLGNESLDGSTVRLHDFSGARAAENLGPEDVFLYRLLDVSLAIVGIHEVVSKTERGRHLLKNGAPYRSFLNGYLEGGPLNLVPYRDKLVKDIRDLPLPRYEHTYNRTRKKVEFIALSDLFDIFKGMRDAEIRTSYSKKSFKDMLKAYSERVDEIRSWNWGSTFAPPGLFSDRLPLTPLHSDDKRRVYNDKKDNIIVLDFKKPALEPGRVKRELLVLFNNYYDKIKAFFLQGDYYSDSSKIHILKEEKIELYLGKLKDDVIRRIENAKDPLVMAKAIDEFFDTIQLYAHKHAAAGLSVGLNEGGYGKILEAIGNFKEDFLENKDALGIINSGRLQSDRNLEEQKLSSETLRQTAF